MVKLPGAVTEGGHKPATWPLPFLTWIFYRTIREIEGSQGMRSPCHALSSGSGACRLFGYAQVIAAPSSGANHHYYSFAPLFTGERWEKLISSHLDLLPQGDRFLALETRRVLNLLLRDFLAVTLTFQDSVCGANYMSPHTIFLSLVKYRKINLSRGLEMTWYHWLTVIKLDNSAPCSPHLPQLTDLELDTHQMFSSVNVIIQAPEGSVLLCVAVNI